MRLDDTLLDYSEAHDTTKAMLALIKGHYVWDWPSKSSHLTLTKDDRDPEGRKKHPDEDDEEYTDRMQMWEAWPNKQARNEKGWLKCALISARVLDCLQTSRENGQSLRGTYKGSRYYFNPKIFYEYTWMCLNQGYGPHSWRQQPPKPETSETSLGSWYRNQALAKVKTVIARWNKGEKLGKIIPVITLDILLGRAPYIMEIKDRLEQAQQSIDDSRSRPL
ncbi:hypothetical protein COCC4DRAFT_33199, partial [Bipolaris maydis ATCC 48331]